MSIIASAFLVRFPVIFLNESASFRGFKNCKVGQVASVAIIKIYSARAVWQLSKSWGLIGRSK